MMTVTKLIVFILLACFTISTSCSSSPLDQDSKSIYAANSNNHWASYLPCFERHIAEPYFRQYDSLVDSHFQEFLVHKFSVGSDEAFIRLLDLERHLIGEGSHRHLSSSFRFRVKSDSVPAFRAARCEVIMIERLPSGVFADPFELEHLVQRGVFKGASVFGDVNLELPSFRSNRSVVEVHLDATLNKSSGHEIAQEFKIEIPLHARYPPLKDSGYSEVRFGAPDLLMRCKTPEDHPDPTCLLTSIASSATLRHNDDDVMWSIPAGIKAHAGTVSVVTFASAFVSAILIIIASLQHSRMKSTERLKRS